MSAAQCQWNLSEFQKEFAEQLKNKLAVKYGKDSVKNADELILGAWEDSTIKFAKASRNCAVLAGLSQGLGFVGFSDGLASNDFSLCILAATLGVLGTIYSISGKIDKATLPNLVAQKSDAPSLPVSEAWKKAMTEVVEAARDIVVPAGLAVGISLAAITNGAAVGHPAAYILGGAFGVCVSALSWLSKVDEDFSRQKWNPDAPGHRKIFQHARDGLQETAKKMGIKLDVLSPT